MNINKELKELRQRHAPDYEPEFKGNDWIVVFDEICKHYTTIPVSRGINIVGSVLFPENVVGMAVDYMNAKILWKDD